MRFLEDGETFDPATGVLHERSLVRDAEGNEREFDLWTTCFTARELDVAGPVGRARGRRACTASRPAGTVRSRPRSTDPEILLLARRPNTFAKSGSNL